MEQKGEERRARERNDPYSPANLARRGQPQGSNIEWSREDKARIQDRKDLEEEDASRDEIEFSESEGERN